MFDQNSSAYSSTNNAWKSWLKEFDSLVGLIDAYDYKSDANSALVKKLPQTRMSAKQVETAITNEKDRIMKNANFETATAKTQLRNVKIKIAENNKGKYWNATSKYPVSQNEFITEFFDDDEDNIKLAKSLSKEPGIKMKAKLIKSKWIPKFNDFK